MKKTINYWDRISYTSSDSEVKRTEELSAENEDALYEKFYKMNNSLRYCNGSFYQFENALDQSKYRTWQNNLSKNKSFELYYGNGIVD